PSPLLKQLPQPSRTTNHPKPPPLTNLYSGHQELHTYKGMIAINIERKR
nr:hypothetical protein [Tanacetum cinerariifolium]